MRTCASGEQNDRYLKVHVHVCVCVCMCVCVWVVCVCVCVCVCVYGFVDSARYSNLGQAGVRGECECVG